MGNDQNIVRMWEYDTESKVNDGKWYLIIIVKKDHSIYGNVFRLYIDGEIIHSNYQGGWYRSRPEIFEPTTDLLVGGHHIWLILKNHRSFLMEALLE